ncbi:MAG: hypothetical protein MI924_05935 [Chloroflexales bacterium]|nr:hypothetical protein [Chloroflexales bacterium]
MSHQRQYAPMEGCHPVAEPCGLVQIVKYKNNRHPLFMIQAAHKFQYLELMTNIKKCGWLVKQ